MSFLYQIENLAQKSLSFWPQSKPPCEKLERCKIVAHRGAHDNRAVLENSWKAFDLCKDHNIWGIEFDVRFTKDGIPVIHHDPHLGRFFSKPEVLIADLNIENLQSSYPQIPTLEKVIADFGGQLHFMIEIKEQLDSEKVATLKRLLEALTPIRDYHFLYLDQAKRFPLDFAPNAAHILVGELNIFALSHLALKGDFGGIAGSNLLIRQGHIEKHHAFGQKVGTGQILDRAGLFREIHRDVDWIFTDEAIKLQSILEEYSKL